MDFEEPRRWCAAFFSLLLASVLLIAGAAWTIDFYDLFHPSRHAVVRLYSNERMGKYLLSLAYIPKEFNGLLIGSSVSENWPITSLGTVQVYNASLSGANISEEKLIAENVFSRGRIKLVVFCIHPYLTMTHGLKSSYMTSQDYWAAFGSLPLFREYAGAILTRMGRRQVLIDEYGVTYTGYPDPKAEAIKERRSAPLKPEDSPTGFDVDEKAVDEYAELVRAARGHGARIVAFIPPISAAEYEKRGEALRAYFPRIRALFAPDEPIVDFNAPQYAVYRENPATFVEDGTHLTQAAAAVFSRALVNALQESGAADPRRGVDPPNALPTSAR
jgi:hypothetical protein